MTRSEDWSWFRDEPLPWANANEVLLFAVDFDGLLPEWQTKLDPSEWQVPVR